ncbi:phosphotransferase enzyme family protein [Glaciimonas sp. PAMC28666]|uniref:phosphotransferase enzyme family protein n=1 Tax=Glaciimonas sp. PAMC28666 TaxID=2807626 RepID=UPI0019623DEC|nr:phosphotransferase [Glaciimonas sp. PAMC28666]QRX82830.1 phosphotransferase [Glaciimonas sp. PAMC28666]
MILDNDSASMLSHGLAAESVAPAWPPLTLAEIKHLLVRYPQVGEIKRLVWFSPRPFSSACVVDTASGRLFVKRLIKAIRSCADLVEEHRFIAHLASHIPPGGPAVSEVLSDITGATAIADGDWTYEVHRLGQGKDIYRDAFSWTPFEEATHAYAAGRALAQFHQGAAGYDAPPRKATLLVSGFSIASNDDPLAAMQDYIDARPGLADYVAQRNWRQDAQRVLMPFHQRLQPFLKKLVPLWTHNDWHASNLLWQAPDGPYLQHGRANDEAAQVATILDFGLCDKTCAVYDLAIAIVTNTIEWLRLPEHAAPDGISGAQLVHFDQLDALLDGYETVTPLSAFDVAAVAAMLPLAHVEFALSELAYFYGVQNSAENAAVAYDTYLLGHAEWFNSAAGIHLLAHIQGRVITS